jgi:hypothetical protein
VDLGEEPADAIRRGGDLFGEVIVVTAQHPQLRDVVVGDPGASQSLRHGPVVVSDDGGIAGIGFGLTGVPESRQSIRSDLSNSM